MFEENSLIGKIARGEFPKKEIESKYGKFVVVYPSGLDSRVIGRKQASYTGGLPLNSYSLNDQVSFEIDATLSVVVKEYPEDFPTAWKNDGIVDFPDQEVKNSIFREFNIFYSETQKGISTES